ncbi:MAG: thermonuclease family protein [Proteobacteria bacterium]|nr:thermonuclease family protein [Pseudomonadota bacterium]
MAKPRVPQKMVKETKKIVSRMTFRYLAALGCFGWALVVTTGTAAQQRPSPEPAASGTVQTIVDGDTLILRSGVQVRLVGIQAPKLPLGRRGFKEWPLAAEARAALARLTSGKTLKLSYGGRKSDRHGRLLAHLTTPDGAWVQGALLTDGMARVYTFPDNRGRAAEMLALEKSAREARRGIWALAYYRLRTANDLGRDIGTFQVIEGTVIKAAIVRGRAYLNFGQNWRTDFTIAISPKWMRRHWRDGPGVASYEGRPVRVRGWLKSFNGPLIEATHPEQIEIVP